MIQLRPAVSMAVFVAMLGAGSCHTTQPTQSGGQTVSVRFAATATNALWFCWDTATATVFCERDDVGGQPELAGRAVPWTYSVVVSVIPAGQTAERIVASSVDAIGDLPAGFPIFGNLTEYDLTVEAGKACPNLPTDCTGLTHPRRVSQGSRDYAQFANIRLAEPNILGQPSAFTFSASKGDTIIVRARKQLESADPGVLQDAQSPELKISGELLIDGVSANSLGTTSSSGADASGVTFSYTIR